jgi:hypothetical protein
VNFLWSLQLFQLILVIIAQAVFGPAGYIGIIECAKKCPWAYSWALERVYDICPTRHSTMTAELVCRILRLLRSVDHNVLLCERRRMAETLCRVVSIAGFFYMFPVYFAIWYSIITKAPEVVGGLVIWGILLPIVIAVAEEFESGYSYLLYLLWFMVLIIFSWCSFLDIRLLVCGIRPGKPSDRKG